MLLSLDVLTKDGYERQLFNTLDIGRINQYPDGLNTKVTLLSDQSSQSVLVKQTVAEIEEMLNPKPDVRTFDSPVKSSSEPQSYTDPNGPRNDVWCGECYKWTDHNKIEHFEQIGE